MIKPFKHQKKSLDHDLTTDVVFDCSDPGTGKTAVAIWAFQRRRKKKSGCALIVAPKTLLHSTWAKDFKTFAPGLKTSVATAANREHAFSVDADAYIINIDAATWLGKRPKHFFKKFDTIVLDESTAFKHATSQRSRAMARVVKHFEYRRALTGTPNSRSITDVWHQIYLLDDGKRLGPSFYAFRNSVCEPRQVGRNKNAIEWTDKDGAEEAVFGLLSDIVIRHRFEDCVDIPPNHVYTIDYELPPKHRKYYTQMEQLQLMALNSGKIVTAVNAATVATKLLQIGSGAVYAQANDSHYELLDRGRYETVLDLVGARNHCLVLFQWKHQRDLLTEEAEKRGLTYCVIDGDVTNDSERARLVEEYQRGVYRVMFAHPKSAGHGLTLTRGTTTIWPSPTANLEWFIQASKRQHRIGQTAKTETITLVAPGTYEERVYFDILQGKNFRMQTLLELFAA